MPTHIQGVDLRRGGFRAVGLVRGVLGSRGVSSRGLGSAETDLDGAISLDLHSPDLVIDYATAASFGPGFLQPPAASFEPTHRRGYDAVPLLLPEQTHRHPGGLTFHLKRCRQR